MAILHTMSDHLKMELAALRAEQDPKPKTDWAELIPELILKLAMLAVVVFQVYLIVTNVKAVFFALVTIVCAFFVSLFYLCINVFFTLLGALITAVKVWLFHAGTFDWAEILSIWQSNFIPDLLYTIWHNFLILLQFLWPLLILILLWLLHESSLWTNLLWKLTPSSGKSGGESVSRYDRIAELEAGIAGEEKMGNILARLPDSYDVFQNLYVTHRGERSETDFVVLGPSGIFVIEVKNYSGSVLGGVTDEKLTHKKKNASASQIYNPVRQVGTHVYRLATKLRDAGYDVWVTGMVGFVGSADVSLSGTSNVPVFSGTTVSGIPTHILQSTPQTPLSAADQRKIVALLKQGSTSAT